MCIATQTTTGCFSAGSRGGSVLTSGVLPTPCQSPDRSGTQPTVGGGDLNVSQRRGGVFICQPEARESICAKEVDGLLDRGLVAG